MSRQSWPGQDFAYWAAVVGAVFAAAVFAAAAFAAAAFAAATAATPWGLAAELPAEVAEAMDASQLSDNSTSLVAVPLLFGGGANLLSTWLVTTQSDQDFSSPTVVDTTGLKPAPLRLLVASLYFFPTTEGDALAEATIVSENIAVAARHPEATSRVTHIEFITDPEP